MSPRPPADSADDAERGPGAGAGVGVAIAGLVAGLGGLVVQLITANALTPQDNARFLVYWSLLFGVFGLLAGVQNETTRSVSAALSAARRAGAVTTRMASDEADGASPAPSGPAPSGPAPSASPAPSGPAPSASPAPSGPAPSASPHAAPSASPAPSPSTPRVLLVGLGIGLVMAVVAGALAPLWLPSVAPGIGPGVAAAVVASVVLGTLAFSGEVATLGALAGSGRWTNYALLSGGEAVVRLILTVAVLLTGASLAGFEVAAAAAAATWLLLLLVRPSARVALHARADRPLGPYLRSTLQAILAAVGTSVLVTGYAVMIDVTTAPEIVDESAPFLLTVSLTRATLLMPMYALQGIVITAVVAKPQNATRLVARAAAVIAAVGLFGAGLAWLIGPWLLNVLRPGYYVPGNIMFGLMLGAVCLALLVLAGAVCLALNRHRDYVAGWLLAVVVALVVLFLPLDLEPRVIASLVTGPLAGAAWHLKALSAVGRARRAVS